ncbi:cellulase family glycosylhydrolase [Mycobacterium sp.]|uniref:cellulase family glycosylhydrolase n=1 Tax=Mycobacterium sp. TaxID=1785 RepID=UPI002DAA82D7|nr:cellulase family glycosylhydrolase [Mycobacterium sp.]
MRQENKGRIKRPIIKIGIAVTASAVMSAGAVSLFTSASPVATMPFVTTAAIDTSNTTVGFADSDLYGMTSADVDRTLDEMQAMGVQNVRILIPWSGIEVVDDFYYWDTVDYLVNAAYERDMGVLGVLNSTPAWAVEPGQAPVVSPPASTEEYAEFVGAVAERYAGKISAYEVWNEPNAYFFWSPAPDPAAYTELLQAAYPAIKAADPDATVIGGVVGWVTDTENLAISPANYVAGMYEAGAQGYFDALSYHPYHYTLPFSQGELYGDISPIGQLELMRELMVANGDGDKLIWATEYGEPTSVVDEATQAAFIQDYLSTWSEFSYTGPSFIYTTRDRDTESTVVDDTFGVLRDDWSRKPAAEVIEQWTTTYPQAPDPVDLVAVTAPTSTTPTTTAEVASMEATAVPSSALTTEPAATTTAPEPTATAPEPTDASAEPAGTTDSTDSARSNGSTKKTR